MKPEIIHLILIVVIIIVIGLITALVTRKSPSAGKDRFDERQLLAQGQANRYAYYTLMLSLAVCVAYDRCAKNPVIDLNTLVVVCICISVVVMAVTAIMKDAYVAYTQKTGSRALLIGVLGAANLLGGLPSIIDGTVIQNGSFGLGAIQLAVAAMAFVIVAAMAIRGAIGKKEAALEESEDE